VNPDTCDDLVFRKGSCIAVLGGENKQDVERWCREASDYLGFPVDWHYVGGRPRVLALGDTERARRVFIELVNGFPPGIVRVSDEMAEGS